MISIANLRPLDDRLLLLRLPPLGDDSLIVVPDVSKQPSKRGKVVRRGPGRKFSDGVGRLPLHVQFDDVVYYQSCDYDDGTHVLIQEADILGIEKM